MLDFLAASEEYRRKKEEVRVADARGYGRTPIGLFVLHVSNSELQSVRSGRSWSRYRGPHRRLRVGIHSGEALSEDEVKAIHMEQLIAGKVF